MFDSSVRRHAFVLAACAALVTLSTMPAAAQRGSPRPEHLVFIGAGTQESTTNVPFSIGYQFHEAGKAWFFGADLASEGSQNDNTYGSSSVEAALAFDALLGRSFRLRDGLSFDLGLVAGGRQTAKDCPKSYLGYQCYADQAPEVSYTFNGGGLAQLAIGRVVLGVRKTTVSTQALIGMGF